MSDCPDLKIGCMPSYECLTGISTCGAPGVDLFGGGVLNCRWADVWGGDCAAENRLFSGMAGRGDFCVPTGGQRLGPCMFAPTDYTCFETTGAYVCAIDFNTDYLDESGRGGKSNSGFRVTIQTVYPCGGKSGPYNATFTYVTESGEPPATAASPTIGWDYRVTDNINVESARVPANSPFTLTMDYTVNVKAVPRPSASQFFMQVGLQYTDTAGKLQTTGIVVPFSCGGFT